MERQPFFITPNMFKWMKARGYDMSLYAETPYIPMTVEEHGANHVPVTVWNRSYGRISLTDPQGKRI